MNATRQQLDAGRWHWQHGPIDIVAEAQGEHAAVAAAHEAAWQRLQSILPELVAELPTLRRPVDGGACPLRGVVAQRMWRACAAPEVLRAAGFITPMAAVAGAVAQELMAAYARPGVTRAWINNGGDIALQLAPGQSARVGLFADLARFDPRDLAALPTDAQFELRAADPVRGIATSGWRGRSFSRGIADSVTVLAASAAEADAAATVIGNAVDIRDNADSDSDSGSNSNSDSDIDIDRGHDHEHEHEHEHEHVGEHDLSNGRDRGYARIVRRPASQLKDDSDLGELLVTVEVPRLPTAQVQAALDAGALCARALQRAGLVWAVLLVCQGQWRRIEPLCSADARQSAPLAVAPPPEPERQMQPPGAQVIRAQQLQRQWQWQWQRQSQLQSQSQRQSQRQSQPEPESEPESEPEPEQQSQQQQQQQSQSGSVFA